VLEEKESKSIIMQGTFSINSKGREKWEENDDIRTCFMVDRDRIIHSKSFRRLKHKTQVFIKTFGDHYRTRLTHTLEVAQIARTIGKGIGLNEDLIEAIALGHDIGHVAFAHNGEEFLNSVLPNGFRHNENSIRVLTKIEKEGKGLNLTKEVLDGILNHNGFSNKLKKAYTLEGQVVKYSDKIAYVNHDIDDSIRAGLISEKELPQSAIKILGNTNSKRINLLVTNCIHTTLNNIKVGKIEVSLSDEIEEALSNLRKFMFQNIYLGDKLKDERKKARYVLEQLYSYFIKNQEELPKFYKQIAKEEGLHQGVADYIAGMSDDYCLIIFHEKFIPKLIIN
jgi:dGTPase